jgi:uncharacterized membrane protein (DUF4010 family)
MPLELLKSLVTALFIGALVGTERTHHQRDDAEDFGGLRTFVLVAELGAVCAWVSRALSSASVLVAGFIGVGLLTVVAYLAGQLRGDERPGMTTEVAALVVYVLGAVAVFDAPLLAVALGIATAALLALKGRLHTAIERISREDLLATLRLLFASFIVLPLLPNEPVDPWGALNPFKLWLLVVLISALSMVGYVAVRVFGAARGTLLTGFFGGLVSSTAATVTLAKQSREPDAPVGALAAATLTAWTVMFLRVIVIVGALGWAAMPKAAAALGTMAVAALLSGLVALRGASTGSPAKSRELDLKNPFRLRSAIKFALLFGFVLVASKLAQRYLPGAGLYGLSALAGSTDVDAVALGLLELFSDGEATVLLVVHGLLLAAIANTWIKLLVTFILGDRRLFWRLVAPSVAISAVGGVMMVFVLR